MNKHEYCFCDAEISTRRRFFTGLELMFVYSLDSKSQNDMIQSPLFIQKQSAPDCNRREWPPLILGLCLFSGNNLIVFYSDIK